MYLSRSNSSSSRFSNLSISASNCSSIALVASSTVFSTAAAVKLLAMSPIISHTLCSFFAPTSCSSSAYQVGSKVKLAARAHSSSTLSKMKVSIDKWKVRISETICEDF